MPFNPAAPNDLLFLFSFFFFLLILLDNIRRDELDLYILRSWDTFSMFSSLFPSTVNRNLALQLLIVITLCLICFYKAFAASVFDKQYSLVYH